MMLFLGNGCLVKVESIRGLALVQRGYVVVADGIGR